MSILAGYTRSTDDENIVIGTYDTMALAEAAVALQTLSNVASYWLATFIDTDTNEPNIFAYIDP